MHVVHYMAWGLMTDIHSDLAKIVEYKEYEDTKGRTLKIAELQISDSGRIPLYQDAPVKGLECYAVGYFYRGALHDGSKVRTVKESHILGRNISYTTPEEISVKIEKECKHFPRVGDIIPVTWQSKDLLPHFFREERYVTTFELQKYRKPGQPVPYDLQEFVKAAASHFNLKSRLWNWNREAFAKKKFEEACLAMHEYDCTNDSAFRNRVQRSFGPAAQDVLDAFTALEPQLRHKNLARLIITNPTLEYLSLSEENVRKSFFSRILLPEEYEGKLSEFQMCVGQMLSKRLNERAKSNTPTKDFDLQYLMHESIREGCTEIYHTQFSLRANQVWSGKFGLGKRH